MQRYRNTEFGTCLLQSMRRCTLASCGKLASPHLAVVLVDILTLQVPNSTLPLFYTKVTILLFKLQSNSFYIIY